MLYHMLAGRPALSETRDRIQRLNVSRFHEITPIQEYVPDIPGIVNHLLQRTLAFKPEERLQTAVALQAEVKKVIDALEKGPARRSSDPQAMAEYEDDELPTNEGEGYVVMLVESKASLQNVIRDRLKSRGYRVLVISDPNRALSRFSPDEESPADCVLLAPPNWVTWPSKPTTVLRTTLTLPRFRRFCLWIDGRRKSSGRHVVAPSVNCSLCR